MMSFVFHTLSTPWGGGVGGVFMTLEKDLENILEIFLFFIIHPTAGEGRVCF